MNQSNQLLSSLVAYRTYAKFLPHLGRRESLEETINRTMYMHLDKFPKLSRDIVKAFQKVHELKIMPSMRSMQFAGDAVIKNNIRSYNCSFLPIDDVRSFGEIFFVLLSGTGVGYSVQSSDINQLPKVAQPQQEGMFLVQDSIAGWSQALDILMEAYFLNRVRPIWDFSQISPKGTYLKTTGARAPGYGPLSTMLSEVEAKLKLAVGRKLKPIEAHDIVCIVSDAVLSGGIRRAALISLFDKTDTEMLNAKSGDWWVRHPYRARANNSAILDRSTTTREEFNSIFDACHTSQAGEPGFSWTNDTTMGFNPCHEIALNANQFCNLTTVNQTNLVDKKDFLSRIYSATLIGTLQAAYTDFPYIRPKWKNITDKEALLGVSFTGIADSAGVVSAEWLKEGAQYALEVNEKYARKIGINPAARIGAVKPEGSCSTVLGSSSGIHDRHSKDYYLRRVRINKQEPLAAYLGATIPDLVEDDVTSSETIVVTIPQKSPEGAIGREQSTALSLLQRANLYNKYWVAPSHRSGANKHNVSVTLSVRDDEWASLKTEMWNTRDLYSGISLLPYDGGNYRQTPFETCDESIYTKYNDLVKEIDLKQVREEEDNTDRLKQLACVGGVCSLE